MTLAMLPLEITAPIASVLIGVAFGFTLESSGFGDARRLAAQFYFRESRVAKVMFTAIVTCMLLLLWASALGWMDLGRVWVNPTYLASGILGGLVLGVGFIVGGYCPGTSLVSSATGKKDGILFLLGVGVGGLVFNETAEPFRAWYDNAGFLGRVTLPEALGLSAGVVAILVVLMAIGMFVLFDRLGQSIGRRSAAGGAKPAPTGKNRGLVGMAAAGLLLAVLLPAVGQPTLQDRLDRLAPELDKEIADGKIRLESLEVLGLMHNYVQGALGRFRLLLVDVRCESDYNLFHLVDAYRADPEALRGDTGRALSGKDWETAIKVVMAQDDAGADEAYRLLRAQGVLHVYVLAGGIDRWLETFGASEDVGLEALGDRFPASRPQLPVFKTMLKAAGEDFAWKVVPVVKAPKASGGCG